MRSITIYHKNLLLSDPSPRIRIFHLVVVQFMVCLLEGPWTDPPPLSTWEVGKFKRNIVIYCKTYCLLIHLPESESSILRWVNSWSACSKDQELTHLLYLLRRWVSLSATSQFIIKPTAYWSISQNQNLPIWGGPIHGLPAQRTKNWPTSLIYLGGGSVHAQHHDLS
jgi:hypothetical protein